MKKTNWYVVYTRPKFELKVANLLSRKHINNYCPLHNVENQIGDSKKTLLEPLFTSYVFVSIRENEITTVLSTPGVINYLYWLNKPATIADDEVDALRLLLKEYHHVVPEKCVEHQNRTLKNEGCHCIIPDKPSNGTIFKLVLPSLGYNILAKRAHSGV